MSETKPEEQSGSEQGEELEQQESPPESGGEQQESVPDHEQLALLLEDARARADEHWDQVLRLQAELENLRKRQQRELESAHKYALERFVQELLPVKDSLEMGLAAAREVEEESSAKLCEGTELTLKMLQAALEKFGVKEIDPAGQPFDPELHQAMSAVASEGTEPNTVLNVMQKGYLLNDRLIRPAMVVVAK
ncbi:MAG TPA: nucleotide exchange factor GrpE [Gammaproteobacteria bacterium]|nr:nucleotide exchange factor GrpE [Gammaproteobacteria bacterium]